MTTDDTEQYVPTQLASWDDISVIREWQSGERKATARVELERRRRFEATWSGAWSSGKGLYEDGLSEPLMDVRIPKRFLRRR